MELPLIVEPERLAESLDAENLLVVDLCKGSLINTVFTVRRHIDEDGQIREEFRTIQAPSSQPLHSRIWNVVEDEA